MTTLSLPQLPVAIPRGLTIEDHWFTALDGRVVHAAGLDYPVVITGIHIGGDSDLWIQLAPFDHRDREEHRTDRGVLLHCHVFGLPDDALRAVRAHLISHG